MGELFPVYGGDLSDDENASGKGGIGEYYGSGVFSAGISGGRAACRKQEGREGTLDTFIQPDRVFLPMQYFRRLSGSGAFGRLRTVRAYRLQAVAAASFAGGLPAAGSGLYGNVYDIKISRGGDLHGKYVELGDFPVQGICRDRHDSGTVSGGADLAFCIREK